VSTAPAAPARYELVIGGVVGPAIDQMLRRAGVTRTGTVTCVRAFVAGAGDLAVLLDAAVLAELHDRGHHLVSVVAVA
jgi:hypothetical protein